jgi:hypothetical protein
MPLYAQLSQGATGTVVNILIQPTNPGGWIDVGAVTPAPVRGSQFDGTTWLPPDLTLDTNLTALTTKAAAALTANGTFLALATPTAAQVTAQVKLLTRENSAIIRLVIGQLDTITGT